MENVLYLASNSTSRIMHDALYESYINEKIESEERLAFAMKESMILSEADYSNIKILQEAKFSDKIKATYKKFVAFIKTIAAKFMESMSNLLLDEKDYLEKYKDIILKKRPKEDMEYSYTGNYKEGINRIINTEVPLFDYAKFQKSLEAEGDGALVDQIMQGKNFHYDDGETLAEQFKSYYLAYEDGQQEGKFANLNMKDIYNFCYNFNKIKSISEKDINRLEASTRNIESLIAKKINSTGNVNSGGNNTGIPTGKAEGALFLEDEASSKSPGDKDKPQGLEIKNTSTDFTQKAQSTDDRDADAENKAADSAGNAAEGKEEQAINDAAAKWIRVCNPLISAKWTACQQIAKDYMQIIRAHVRSYGGTDKDDKTGNKAPDKASEYKKNNNSIVGKAKRDAEAAQKAAEKAQNDANK